METKELQVALNTLGFRCLISGSIDAATADALTEFQRNYRLTVTGMADEQTIEAIQRLKHAWLGKDCLV
jgi:N-acetyl-anhydromuramyl-L-alanine amidase AmpD